VQLEFNTNTTITDQPIKTKANPQQQYLIWRFISNRQAVHPQTQKYEYNHMCRLAAVHAPPGGFWKNPENANNTENSSVHNPNMIQYTSSYE